MSDKVKTPDQSTTDRSLADFVLYLSKIESTAEQDIARRDKEAAEMGEGSLGAYLVARKAHEVLRHIETARDLLADYQQSLQLSAV